MMEIGVGPAWSVLLLAAIGLLVLGGMILVVIVLANEKTRVAGLVLLLVLIPVVLLIGAATIMHFVCWETPMRSYPAPMPPDAPAAAELRLAVPEMVEETLPSDGSQTEGGAVESETAVAGERVPAATE
jgi:hypothetical protein